MKNDVAQQDLIAVFDAPVFKLGIGVFSEDDFGSSASGNFMMAANEIGVQVSFDDVLDLKALCFSFFKVSPFGLSGRLSTTLRSA